MQWWVYYSFDFHTHCLGLSDCRRLIPRSTLLPSVHGSSLVVSLLLICFRHRYVLLSVCILAQQESLKLAWMHNVKCLCMLLCNLNSFYRMFELSYFWLKLDQPSPSCTSAQFPTATRRTYYSTIYYILSTCAVRHLVPCTLLPSVRHRT